MLKQSLVQEKLSDLTMATQTTVKVAQNDSDQTNNDIIIPHTGQWPRVQLIKTSSSNSKLKLKSANYALSESPNTSNQKVNLKADQDENEENLEYDGVETVNFYSNYHGNRQRSNLNENSEQPNNSDRPSSQHNRSNNPHSDNFQNKNIKIVADSSQYDPNLKLKYLEKSIKFIQQQHTETLNSLHQEIEKLKDENRGMYIRV